MSIAQAVQTKIKAMPEGQVFGYQALPDYSRSPTAVVKALSRLVEEGQVQRLSKGKFYVAKQGMLGPRKPSDNELIRSVLYKDDRLRGYITGLALFNKLGLTTQVPRTITVALNGGRQKKDFGTIRVRTVSTNAPVREKDVKLLQYLDVLRDIKKIPDANINRTLKLIMRYIAGLDDSERRRLTSLAENYYTAQVRALSGLLLSSLEIDVPRLKRSLNPTTIYKLNLDEKMWPIAKDWNIQ